MSPAKRAVRADAVEVPALDSGLYCEHARTRASCEECLHAAALADPRRAPATRTDLYPYPKGGAVRSVFVPGEDDGPAVSPPDERFGPRKE